MNNLKKSKTKLIIINICLPTSQITKQDGGSNRDATYDLMEEILDEYKHELIIIKGDFNNKIGSVCKEPCAGKYSRSSRNDNGQAMINFACSRNLFIFNT